MDIIKPGFNSFDFNNITLEEPYKIQNDTFYSKINNKNKILLLQTPKSFTNDGVNKKTKRSFIDLTIKKENQNFIEWIKVFEEKIKESINEKTEEWFHNDLTKDDIDYFFNSSIRNKDDKYLMRCYIDNCNKVTNDVIIYDEDQNIKTLNDINKNDELITIIQLKGIHFTSLSFFIDIGIKQIMILNQNQLLNNRLITTNEEYLENSNENLNEIKEYNIREIEKDLEKNDNLDKADNNENNQYDDVNERIITDSSYNETPLYDISLIDISFNNVEEISYNDLSNIYVSEINAVYNFKKLDNSTNDNCNNNLDNSYNSEKEKNNDNNEENDYEESDYEESEYENSSEESEDSDYETDNLEKDLFEPLDNNIKKIDINVNNNFEESNIELRDRDKVYFEIYKKYLNKAKETKQKAIEAFLKAEEIKNKYNIDYDSDESGINF